MEHQHTFSLANSILSRGLNKMPDSLDDLFPTESAAPAPAPAPAKQGTTSLDELFKGHEQSAIGQPEAAKPETALDKLKNYDPIANAINYPTDVADIFKEGLTPTAEFLTQDPKKQYEDRVQALKDRGYSETTAHLLTSLAGGGARSALGLLGMADIPAGWYSSALSPIFGGIRSLLSRPVEEATGFPKEYTELAAGLALGRPKFGMTKREIPISMTLYDSSNAAYDASRAVDIQFRGDKMYDVANKILAKLRADGHVNRPNQASGTFGAVEDIRDLGDPNLNIGYVSPSGIESARKTLVNLTKQRHGQGLRTEDSAAASKAISIFDTEMANTKPADILKGASELPKYLDFIGKARGDWGAYRRVDLLEEALENASLGAAATHKGTNIDNKIRQAFNSIVKSREKSKMYTDDELEMMKGVVRGTKAENLGRYTGAFAPTGIVSTALSGLTGAAITGSAKGAEALLGLGYISKWMADKARERAAQRVMDAIATRSPYYTSQPAVKALDIPKKAFAGVYPALTQLDSFIRRKLYGEPNGQPNP